MTNILIVSIIAGIIFTGLWFGIAVFYSERFRKRNGSK